MTLEELLESDAATLERMTTEQLTEFFKPFLHLTRPEMQRTLGSPAGKPKVISRAAIDTNKARMLRGKQVLLEQYGIDLSNL